MAVELAFMTIAEAARLIEQKRLSPVELTTALIRRTEALDPQLNAYLLLTADRALDQARQAECEIMAGRYHGPMHGIPFALKDIYATAGIRTTGHSKICLDTVPSVDATTVRKLYEAGAVLTGKLATHEFAHGGPSFDLPWPPARNPWNREHYPEPAEIDAATRDRVAVACRAAGLTLSDRQFEMACAAAPYLIAMTGRLNRDRAYIEEPANIFHFGC
jgi:aspartyl-tRNA(Asn)/glutamyl-tRNA(Gln) amidotransferase subunit A